ncbi:DNA-binding protein [Mycolicibacterium fortuitum]|uniref:DNA-binding protein n=2 Tax=Mycolicibacterium fortuitum TaxID=1766 RepID=A0AAE4VG66_MYCFO|nr:DNA-binding protein [Mycolicibacterium fortuitum]MCV7137914.1 DNA-binding protein [Mycolicibacterium fortuitum]MDV7194479.1 DNA-binding protein [Mycolicibacterium fortuitum]MDV7207891.1 DNA-binding protein [Mycolicibacterium fortuitum]MDV7229189.1 DNA-binding protein [Mycolicibacterium fortuitum]MDV7260888.1 DNA-binding protein [Mycolicibacterium fortuitum]
MTTTSAAQHLQVSERQVERLAQAGELTVTRTVAGALLIDAASVHRLAQTDRHSGRPATAATAWAALTLLSGERVGWLDRPALSRLRHRLRGADANSLCWLTRRRATVHRMQGWGNDDGLLPTGVSALRDPAMSALFDLTPVERGSDGYVRASDFNDLVTTLGLFDDTEGSMTVRVVPDNAGYTVDHVLVAAVAADLAESLDARESAAGKRVLNSLLNDFRSSDGHLNRDKTARHSADRADGRTS